MKKMYLLTLCSILFFAFNDQASLNKAETILQKSIQKHDPNNQWAAAVLNLHVQEPRVMNPSRHSVVHLDNSNGAFELKRGRGAHVSAHRIDSKGLATTLLDGRLVTDADTIKRFRLDPNRNKGYRQFYAVLFGLPMSLNEHTLANLGTPQKSTFNGRNCYKIPVELKEAVFSKHWNIFISTEDNSFKGIEIVFPDDPQKGERLYFEGEYQLDAMLLPRMHHWHDLNTLEYLGSDIIVK